MKKTIVLYLALVIFNLSIVSRNHNALASENKNTWWEIQSVDTMKYSRDLAGQFKDSNGLDQTINLQITDIAKIGATHVAIGTPYDSEFLPFLEKWVNAARENNLNVWFRGNWSGWEGWFDYEKITPNEHIQYTNRFIIENPYLFKNGDIFTPCPECENGVIGDPRTAGRSDEYIAFLIDLNSSAEGAFEQIEKDVEVNFNSMNLDVARLVMDKEVTEKLGGVVVVDHYAKSPEKYVSDIKDIAKKSRGQVVLGEFGAPIPDIHGSLSEQDQAEWLAEVLSRVSQNPNLIGVNYWVNVGGTTELWDETGNPREAVSVVQSFYRPFGVEGIVESESGFPIKGANIIYGKKTAKTDAEGRFLIAKVPGSPDKLTVSASGYKDLETKVENDEIKIAMESKSYISKIINLIRYYLQKIV